MSERERERVRARLVLIADVGAIGARVIDEAVAVLGAVPRGSVMLIERDKTGTDDRTRLGRLEKLRAATHNQGCVLAVNTRVDLALAVGADGVHLPESALPTATVRARFPTLLVGRSHHGPIEGGLDWSLLGPIRVPHSKPLTGPVLGFDGFRAYATPTTYALGGIRPEDLATALQAGGAGVATIGGVFGTPDPERAALEFLQGPGPG